MAEAETRITLFTANPKPKNGNNFKRANQQNYMILPIKATNYLGRIINCGGKLNLMPYTWSKSTNRVNFKSRRLIKVVYLSQFILLLLYNVFLMYKSYKMISVKTARLQQKIRTTYITVVYIFLNVQHLVTIRQYGRLHHFMNALVEVTTYFNELYGPVVTGGERRLLLFMKLVSFASLIGCSNALGVFLAPESLTLLTSVFENPKKLPLWIKLLTGFVHIAINLFQFYPVAFYGSVIFVYVYTVLPVIRRMRYRSNQTLQTFNSTSGNMAPHCLRQSYDELVILQNNFNNMFGLWTIGMEVFSIIVVVTNVFQAVVFSSVRAFALGLSTCICLVFLYTKLSQVHEASTHTLVTWKIIGKPIWFTKFHRSCKPLSVAIGSFYSADKFLPLTILSIIFVNSANLIVSFRAE